MELTKEMKDKAKAYNAWFQKGKEEAQKERDEWWLNLVMKLDDKDLIKLVEERLK